LFSEYITGIIGEKMLTLYNSYTQKKERFTSLSSKQIKLYVCGITPYDTTHLGHAFTYLSFDILIRYLQFRGYTVTYTQNVTDIDDDILKRAKRDGRDWEELGIFWTQKFVNDLEALHMIMPTHYVKATQSIPTIIKIVTSLVQKKYAYERKGNVYFAVQSFPAYGKLSKLDEKQMIELSRERGADPDDSNKKHPLDFILWQAGEPDEPSWKSPWGMGRPGWHIECSAMIADTLGEQIDIHGGGFDLIYPHHESEIAQSESFTGRKPFVKTWMHTGMVMYQGEKMAKSLGNLVMVSELLKTYSANSIRYALISHHYREQWEFFDNEALNAKKTIEKLLAQLMLPDQGNVNDVLAALDDDLNTPLALRTLQTFQGAPLKRALTLLGFTV
jgi:cysteinyl-tRNA synthetase